MTKTCGKDSHVCLMRDAWRPNASSQIIMNTTAALQAVQDVQLCKVMSISPVSSSITALCRVNKAFMSKVKVKAVICQP